MNIFDNFNGLVDLLQNSDSNDLDAIANHTGLDKGNVGKIMGLALPLILDAISKRNQDPQALNSFSQALDQHTDAGQVSSLGELTNQVDPEDSDKMLGHIFGENKGSIIDQIANTLGITPAAVKRVLLLLAPVVIKMIASNKKQKGLDNDGVAREADQIKDQLNEKLQKAQDPNASINEGGLLGSILESMLGTGGTTSLNPGQAGGQVQSPVQPIPSQEAPTNTNRGLLGKILDLLK
ncbi:DUF937 domain-containing protein [Vaginisenegalia massiliensis]|uniref:DUF937 domain-containing protein n=1 Tax=Vaginisenegalia massiliensis TaxID=2058294 RepID=UPI000F5278A3|nr:DUF937 domain-containing protein [Vaginisenegalia massiliensis]